MKKSNMIIVVCVTVGMSVLSAFSQINLSSNVINFRSSADMTPTTMHYGNLEIHGSGNPTSGAMLWVKNEVLREIKWVKSLASRQDHPNESRLHS